MFECVTQIQVRASKTERERPRWLTGPLLSSAQAEGTIARKRGEAQEAWKTGSTEVYPQPGTEEAAKLLGAVPRQDISPTKPWLNACPQA